MIKNWIIKLFWNPYEQFCLIFPLIPIKMEITEVSPGIQIIVLNNVATKFLSKFGGGFEYAVLYLIDGELFFDTGYSWAQRTLQNKLFNRIDKNKIKYIVNSHDHEDHTGNNLLFGQTFLNSKIYAHSKALMNVYFPPKKPWYRKFLFGPEEACDISEVPKEFILSSGRKIEVIHTPGHTDGHICLYDRASKILFTGDLFISESLDTQLEEADGPKWIASLKNVLQLEINLVLDGHGIVLKGEDAKKKLKCKLEFLTLLRNRIHKSISKGPISQEEIIKSLNSDPGIINYLSLGEGWMSLITSENFSRSNLVRGFLREYLE